MVRAAVVPEAAALEVRELRKRFHKRDGSYVQALDSLDLHVDRGECVAIIGESGSGKSTLARILMGLETPDSGVLKVQGADPARGRGRGDGGVAVVLQDPADSLDPRYSVLQAIREPLDTNRRGRLSKQEVAERVRQAMESVGLSEALLESRVSRLSGGQQQRVGLARALVTKPSLLILDEPTSALDPSIQAQILDLLQRLQAEEHLSVLLITHDLAVAAFLAHRICVLRSGRLVEVGSSMDIWRRSQHPYTRALMSASLINAPHESSEEPSVEVLSGDKGSWTCEFAAICGPERAQRCPGSDGSLGPIEEGHSTIPHCLQAS